MNFYITWLFLVEVHCVKHTYLWAINHFKMDPDYCWWRVPDLHSYEGSEICQHPNQIKWCRVVEADFYEAPHAYNKALGISSSKKTKKEDLCWTFLLMFVSVRQTLLASRPQTIISSTSFNPFPDSAAFSVQKYDLMFSSAPSFIWNVRAKSDKRRSNCWGDGDVAG